MTQAHTGPVGVADIYVRLSLDRGTTGALNRQERDCRRWCAANDLHVRRVHADRGVSGYAAGTTRHGFDDACAAVASREIDTLVVWKLDRLSRRGIGQVGHLLDQLEQAGGRLVSVMDNLDTGNVQSRMVVALLSEIARAESENMSIRVRSAKEGQRAAGHWVGGTPPYGYALTADRHLVPVEPAASTMRAIIDQVLHGASLLSICRDLNARGVPNGRGRPWRTSALSEALANPSLAGLMPARHVTVDGLRAPGPPPVYRHPDTGEEVSCLADGATPVIARHRQQTAQAFLGERRQRYGRGRDAPGKAPALLSRGLARCAGCGATLVTFGHAYRCRRYRELQEQDCPAPANIQITRLDAEVQAAWTAYVTDPACPAPTRARLLALIAPRDEGRFSRRLTDDAEQLTACRARLTDADTARYITGSITDDRYRHITTELGRTIARLEHRLSAGSGARPAAAIEAAAIGAVWASSTVEQRRQLLGAALEQVRVRRADHAGGVFDRNRLTYAWLVDDARTPNG